MNLLVLTSYYLILLFSIIGFGFFLSKLLKLELKINDIAIYGILGIIFLTFNKCSKGDFRNKYYLDKFEKYKPNDILNPRKHYSYKV